MSSEPAQREPKSRKNLAPKEGYLPVSEFLGELQGAASPFGDDVTFPLPVDRLAYVHPDPEALHGVEHPVVDQA